MTTLVYTIDGQYLENDQVKLDLKTSCEPKYFELNTKKNSVQEEKNPLEKFTNDESTLKTCDPKCKEDEYCDSYIYNNQKNFICRPKK